MKVRQMGAELFHADKQTEDGRTDMSKRTVAFRGFANAPKKIDDFFQ
jgi:hypothetical protein